MVTYDEACDAAGRAYAESVARQAARSPEAAAAESLPFGSAQQRAARAALIREVRAQGAAAVAS